MVGATLHGRADAVITHVESLELAGPGALTFIRSEKYGAMWARSGATAALVSSACVKACGGEEPADSSRAMLVVDDADAALIKVLRVFAPPTRPHLHGIHPSATIEPGATISSDAEIGPNCVVSSGAFVGGGTRLVAGVFIGESARVGQRCTLHPGVRIMDRCSVGNDCILHPGVVVGADGFGYLPGKSGLEKIPHIGNAVIEDDVEIGANSCIDRAKFGSTVIGAGTKIDNLVQVGHNCRVGRSCILCGRAALSGSVTLGDGVVLGGGAGVADNLEVGAGSMVAANSGVMTNVAPGTVMMGLPATEAREARRNYAAFRSLAETLADIKRFMRKSEKSA